MKMKTVIQCKNDYLLVAAAAASAIMCYSLSDLQQIFIFELLLNLFCIVLEVYLNFT